ncbi:MAG: polysaccharide ABC transporter ATP-binding protein [archaeon]
MPDYALQIKNVSKHFIIPLGGKFWFFRKRKKILVLDKINIEIPKGSVVGVIGVNGSGKTTLLRLVAGIFKPSEGNLTINGSVLSLLDIGSGFNEELSGLENIFLYGTLLGMKRKDIDFNLKDIIEFSGLGSFIDARMKDYSNGMRLRLGFSIMSHADADIFLLDEVIAVGDFEFQKKCVHKLHDLKKIGKTILIVSHDINLLKELCDSLILIDKGRIIKVGEAKEVGSYYRQKDTVQIKHICDAIEGISHQLEQLDTPQKKNINNIPMDNLVHKKSNFNHVKKLRFRLNWYIEELKRYARENVTSFYKGFGSFGIKEKKDFVKLSGTIISVLHRKKVLDPDSYIFDDALLLKECLMIQYFISDNIEGTLNMLMKSYEDMIELTHEQHTKRGIADDLTTFIFSLDTQRLTAEEINSAFNMYISLINKSKIYSNEILNYYINAITRFYIHVSSYFIHQSKLTNLVDELSILGSKKINQKMIKYSLLIDKMVALRNKIKPNISIQNKNIIKSLKLINANMEDNYIYRQGEQVSIEFRFGRQNLLNIALLLSVYDANEMLLYCAGKKISGKTSNQTVYFSFETNNLFQGNYFISVSVRSKATSEITEIGNIGHTFKIINQENRGSAGVINLQAKWRLTHE